VKFSVGRAVRRLLALLGAGLCALIVLAGPASAATPVFTPFFTCAAANGDGTYTYFFGYTYTGSTAVTIPIGDQNQFGSNHNNLNDNYGYGGGQDLGQTTTLLPGTHTNAFSVTTKDTSLAWQLGPWLVKVDPAKLCANVPVVAEAPAALVLPLATAAPFAIWFITMRRRTRRGAVAATTAAAAAA
jgi:hypothetical protein